MNFKLEKSSAQSETIKYTTFRMEITTSGLGKAITKLIHLAKSYLPSLG